MRQRWIVLHEERTLSNVRACIRALHTLVLLTYPQRTRPQLQQSPDPGERAKQAMTSCLRSVPLQCVPILQCTITVHHHKHIAPVQCVTILQCTITVHHHEHTAPCTITIMHHHGAPSQFPFTTH
eukprot:1156146-Pelagomonas_calceolata.AAC.2